MGRLGVEPKEAWNLIQKASQSSWVKLRRIYTHYACADSDLQFTQAQWNRFKPFLSLGLANHSCNSAAIFSLPKAHGDCVRPGLALYGISPIAKYQKYLRPVLTWKSRVTFVKTIPAKTPLSYDAIFWSPADYNSAFGFKFVRAYAYRYAAQIGMAGDKS